MKSLLGILVLSLVACSFAAAAPLAPSDYFDQFIFKADGTCSDIDRVGFHELFSWEKISLGLDGKGRPATVSLVLQLFPDHTYWADYEELAEISRTSTTITYTSLCQPIILRGTWTSVGGRLIVSHLGEGLPAMTLNEGKSKATVNFMIRSPLHDARAVGLSTVLGFSATNVGPQGISINKFCGVN